MTLVTLVGLLMPILPRDWKPHEARDQVWVCLPQPQGKLPRSKVWCVCQSPYTWTPDESIVVTRQDDCLPRGVCVCVAGGRGGWKLSALFYGDFSSLWRGWVCWGPGILEGLVTWWGDKGDLGMGVLVTAENWPEAT